MFSNIAITVLAFVMTVPASGMPLAVSVMLTVVCVALVVWALKSERQTGSSDLREHDTKQQIQA